ncbi:MAG: Zn-dependent hydrolase [Bacillota bacterium]|nr:Zn-dependent hydrolase [Bacillota bacterium]
MPAEAPTIDARRLLRRIEELGEIGRLPEAQGGGINRPTYGPAWLEARARVAAWMSEAGLAVRVDAAGNLIGRREGAGGAAGAAAERPVPAIALGSHIDTVPHAGALDGAYGVLAAVEVADAVRRAGSELRHPLEVLVFADEEGRIGGGLFGSRALAGLVEPEYAERRMDVGDAMREAGLDPRRLGEAARKPGELACYVELHVEQGGRLDRMGGRLAVVRGIVGIRRFLVTFRGEANHAGTTEMRGRRDAALAAAHFLLDFRERILERGEGVVGTVGALRLEPGAVNVIPGAARLEGEFRALEAAELAELEAEVARLAEAAAERERCTAEFEPGAWDPPTLCDPRVMAALEAAARERLRGDEEVPRLDSRAGHDAQSMAHLCPVGMLFVPSLGGFSHVPQEATRPEDLVLGAEVLLGATLRLDRTL